MVRMGQGTFSRRCSQQLSLADWLFVHASAYGRSSGLQSRPRHLSSARVFESRGHPFLARAGDGRRGPVAFRHPECQERIPRGRLRVGIREDVGSPPTGGSWPALVDFDVDNAQMRSLVLHSGGQSLVRRRGWYPNAKRSFRRPWARRLARQTVCAFLEPVSWSGSRVWM